MRNEGKNVVCWPGEVRKTKNGGRQRILKKEKYQGRGWGM